MELVDPELITLCDLLKDKSEITKQEFLDYLSTFKSGEFAVTCIIDGKERFVSFYVDRRKYKVIQTSSSEESKIERNGREYILEDFVMLIANRSFNTDIINFRKIMLRRHSSDSVSSVKFAPSNTLSSRVIEQYVRIKTAEYISRFIPPRDLLDYAVLSSTYRIYGACFHISNPSRELLTTLSQDFDADTKL